MNFEIINKNILDELHIKEDNVKEIYGYKKSGEIIGLIIIKNSNDDMLYFTIFEKYQNLGYGKKMIKDLLDLLRKIGYKELNLIVDRKNIKATKIISSLGGHLLSNINNLSKYRVDL